MLNSCLNFNKPQSLYVWKLYAYKKGFTGKNILRTFCEHFGVLRFLSVTTDILIETNSNSNSFSLQLQSADPQYWFTLQQ